MTKKGKSNTKEKPTITNDKTLKKQKLRNNEYYDMQSIFDRLYQDSLNGKVFKNLVSIMSSEENIKLAYRNLKTNRGSKTAGIDNKTIDDMKISDKKFIMSIQKSFEYYTPNKIKRVEIPKDNGKTRPLGIPTIKDRIIQQCILQVLEPICEAKFHENSNGFRPNRSAENAMAQTYKIIQRQNIHYVIDIDIKGFFDNVSHAKLLKQMWHLGIREKKLLSIISVILKSEIAEIGFPTKGTPQGGIISPLLSNIVLNEFDWWISSQWENMITKDSISKQYNSNGSSKNGYKYSALRKSNLKEVYFVRYADDFKVFCKNFDEAKRLFIAIQMWLKERLGLDISKEKSKIVNLRENYSEFLGLKIKVRKKGYRKNGDIKYVVQSHIIDKRLVKIQKRAKELINQMSKTTEPNEIFKLIGVYNSFIMGVHNYYRMATNINIDFHKISYLVSKNLKYKLKDRLNKPKNLSELRDKLIVKKYSQSKMLRCIQNKPIIPIGYVQHKSPMCKKRIVNNYTIEGRNAIHTALSEVTTHVLHYLMRNPVMYRSIEYNDNRISLYSAQNGKCFVTNRCLNIEEIHTHHIKPKSMGGDDSYKNLVIIHKDVHILIHSTNTETINKYLLLLNLDKSHLTKINKFRATCNLKSLEFEMHINQ